MAQSLTCTRVVRSGGKIYLTWSDGAQNEFESIQQAHDYIRGVLNVKVLRALLLAKALSVVQDGSTIDALQGRTITQDFTLAANIVRVT